MKLPGSATDYGVSAYCDAGDPVTGGGWSEGGTGVYNTHPVKDPAGAEGWYVYAYGASATVYAVCLDNPPTR